MKEDDVGVAKEQKEQTRVQRRARSSGPKQKAPFRGFVDFVWSVDLTDECREWAYGADNMLYDMGEMVEAGFVFRFVVDIRGGGVQVQCYGADGDALTEGLAMSGRGSTAGKALKNFLFEHEQCGHDWTSIEYPTSRGASYND